MIGVSEGFEGGRLTGSSEARREGEGGCDSLRFLGERGLNWAA